MAQQPNHKPGSPALPAGSTFASAGLRKGRPVPIPSSALPALEQAHGPGRILFGKVKGKDESHSGCVLIKCVEDPRTFSLNTQQVRQWLATYALQSSTNTFVEADKLEQEQAHVQGNLPRSSKRARMERSSPAENGTSRPVSSSMASEEQEEEFLPPSGPPKKGVTRRAEVLDLIGKEVDVPGQVFHDHTPGVYLRAYIIGPDSEHASAVELYLLRDPRTMYYFHASEVRHWVRLMQVRKASKQDVVNQQDAEDEAIAAEVLAHLSRSSSDTPTHAQPSKPAAAQTPPATLPDFATQAKGPGHKKKRVSLAPAPSGRAAATPPPLQWGPTQVLAQCASALPPVLAEQLARIANAQGGTQQAAGSTPSAALQVLSSKPASADAGMLLHRTE